MNNTTPRLTMTNANTVKSIHISEEEIFSAVSKGEFSSWYQPKIHLHSMDFAGMEILMRWQHPSKGIILPLYFLQDIISQKLLNPITESILIESLEIQKKFIESGNTLPLSLNLDAAQVENSEFIEKLLSSIPQHEQRTRSITFEITEKTDIRLKKSSVSKNLMTIKNAGIRISIDDYGTGYSSLDRLCNIPCDELKLDRLFIRKILNSKKHFIALENTLKMAHSMDIQVVAEGVENKEQLLLLQSLGCDFAQGFLFSPAIPHTHIKNWYKRWNGAILL